jgi:hypothetical protein
MSRNPGLEFVNVQAGGLDHLVGQGDYIGEETALPLHSLGYASFGRKGMNPAGLAIALLDYLVGTIEEENFDGPAIGAELAGYGGKIPQEALFPGIQGKSDLVDRRIGLGAELDELPDQLGGQVIDAVKAEILQRRHGGALAAA